MIGKEVLILGAHAAKSKLSNCIGTLHGLSISPCAKVKEEKFRPFVICYTNLEQNVQHIYWYPE